MIRLLLSIIELTGPLSKANANIYIQKHNKLLKEVKKHFDSGKNIGKLCDYFSDQWDYVANFSKNREIGRALMSPAMLSDSYSRNGVEISDLLKIPEIPQEVAIESFRKFILFRQSLADILSIDASFQENVIKELQSNDEITIEEIKNNTYNGTDCFEYKEGILYARIIVEKENRLLIVKPNYEVTGVVIEVIKSIRYSELSVELSQEDQRKINIKDEYGETEVIFEDKTKPVEINERILKAKEESEMNNLKKIQDYLGKIGRASCRERVYVLV